MPIAPAASPRRSKIGAAIDDSPITASSRSAAQPVLAHRLERLAERGRRSTSVACVSRGRPRARSSSVSSGPERQQRLAERRRVQRQLRADLEDLQAVVGPEDVVDDQHAVAVQRADAHRLAGAHRERVGPRQRAAAQLVDVEVDVAELEQRGAELVLARLRVLLDEALVLQRLQEAVDGALREAEAVGDLRHAEPPRSAGEGAQDRRRALDRLDRHLSSSSPL